MLYGMDAQSPTMKLIMDLKRAGCDVEACRIEVMSLKHHLEVLRSHVRDACREMENMMNNSVRFRISQ